MPGGPGGPWTSIPSTHSLFLLTIERVLSEVIQYASPSDKLSTNGKSLTFSILPTILIPNPAGPVRPVGPGSPLTEGPGTPAGPVGPGGPDGPGTGI